MKVDLEELINALQNAVDACTEEWRTALETRQEVLEEWIDELQAAIVDLPEGVIRASLMDTHESLCKMLYSELVRSGELQSYILQED